MASSDEAQISASNAQIAASSLHNNSLNDASHTSPTSSLAADPSSSSRPVEMADLSAQSAAQNESPQSLSHQSTTPANFQKSKENEKSNIGTQQATSKIIEEDPSLIQAATSGNQNAKPPPLGREQTNPAIGAATDQPTPNLNASEIEAATLMITLLLHTGARHPYKIDEKYLKKRSVSVADNNPINMSVYTLKELIWRDWRDGEAVFEKDLRERHDCWMLRWLTALPEWDPRPASPSSIRLIHFGKLLDDKSHLKGMNR